MKTPTWLFPSTPLRDRSAPRSGLDRRQLLQSLGALGATLVLAPRARAQAGRPSPLWISVQASGGWDQALFCDPQPTLRGPYLDRDLYLYGVPVLENGVAARGTGIVRNPTAGALRTTPGGGIRYLGFADFHGEPDHAQHPYVPFFPRYFDRVTVFNGLDASTNNHAVGERYCASGSLNEGGPCVAAQLACALGPTRPLTFLNMGGYGETAGLVPATPMRDSLLPNLLAAVAPNDVDGDNAGDDAFLHPDLLAQVDAAQARRRARQRAHLTLPGHQRALAAASEAAGGGNHLKQLRFRSNDLTMKNLLQVGLEAWRQGLAVSMNVTAGGFDSHEDNEQQQVKALYDTLELLKLIIDESEQPEGGAAPVPVVALVSSDFGRTPHRTAGGTDHWPIASMLVLQNRPAQALGLALPTNTTIGGTTDGGVDDALRPRRINPRTLAFDDGGIVPTPGHVVRVIRRMAGVADHPRLARFPLSVEGDLNLG